MNHKLFNQLIKRKKTLNRKIEKQLHKNNFKENIRKHVIKVNVKIIFSKHHTELELFKTCVKIQTRSMQTFIYKLTK
jgi:hypothetical protein